jgi:hypothetical protein
MQPKQLEPSTGLVNKPQKRERWAMPVTLAFIHRRISALRATQE